MYPRWGRPSITRSGDFRSLTGALLPWRAAAGSFDRLGPGRRTATFTLSAFAAALATAFGLVVADRWRRTRRAPFAAWAAGLLVFAAAAAVQAAGERSGFSPALFRAFYLLGGVLGVTYLALGTVYLLAPARAARASAVALVAVTAACSVDAALVHVDVGALASPQGILGGAIPRTSLLHVAAIGLNIVGTAVLAGGSAWSAWRFWRDRAGLDRVVCNLLLTAGAVIIAVGFSAAKTVGSTLSTLGGYEAAGMGVMFAGFLCLGRVGRPIAAAAVRRPRPAGG